MIKSIILVGLGSCAGGMLRYAVSLLLHTGKAGFPAATFLVNIAGCLLIGLIYGIFSRLTDTSSSLCLLLTTGFCGGFTTFSAFSNEALKMLQNGNLTGCLLYVLGSIVLGILAVAAGYLIVRLLFR